MESTKRASVRAHENSTSDSDEPEAKVEQRPSGVHQEIIAKHYNSREDGGHRERNQSKIIHMRNFNNWIKSELINKYVVGRIRPKLRHGEKLRVLDMCCGKGGDLIKWKQAGIQHLVCTDIAKVSVEQCQQRYENMGGQGNFGYSIEYIDCDATVDSQATRYKDASLKFQAVSCQFALHYCFESLPQAEQMLLNASECLAPGGVFFGTIPNANEIMKRSQLSDEGEFGNAVYKISFECNTKAPPLFGAKYHFYLDGVVNCPEFLVHFPTLVKLAKRYGLRLIEHRPFGEFFRERIEERPSRNLLERMNALETFNSRRQLNSDEEAANYHTAKDYLESNPNVQQVGTLSRCEWETICLYMVFAFEKVRGEYIDGKMVYNI